MSEVNDVKGRGGTVTVSMVEFEQFPTVEVSFTKNVPGVLKTCVGFVSTDVLSPPLNGSPKFHRKDAAGDVGILLLVKGRTSCLQAIESTLNLAIGEWRFRVSVSWTLHPGNPFVKVIR